jgi:hypothetical protein
MNHPMSSYAKAILAFVSLALTNLIAVVANTDGVLPQTVGQWVTAVLTTLGGTFAVWAKSNQPSTP